MEILVFSGDVWHKTTLVRKGLEGLSEKDFSLHWGTPEEQESTADLSKTLKDYPLWILAKSNNQSEQVESPWFDNRKAEQLKRYLQKGGSLLVIHSGLAGYGILPEMRRIMGGTFLRHPEPCPVFVEPLKGHPLTDNLDSYTLEDEHYIVELDDPAAEVFLRTYSDQESQPGGWIRKEGKGRVCVLTPSHTLEGWTYPVFQTLLERTVKWCLAMDDGRE